MWTTRLLILGLVRWLQPVHGYEVQRELMSWGVQSWAEIKRGSIYHALKKLAVDGRLDIVTTESVDNRPARTTYRITAVGEEEFQTRLREALWNVEADHTAFWIAWSFVPVLSHRECAAMLRNRAAAVDQIASDLDELLASRSDLPWEPNFLPTHVKVSLQHKRNMLVEGGRWCTETALLAESGELYPEHTHDMSPETVRNWKEHINRLDDGGRIQKPA